MIRPFQLGDFFLIQRLNRQATRFFTVQTLLQSHAVLATALGSAVPWARANVTTYVLRQDGHGLVHDGFLQVQKRHGNSVVDVLCLAPGLEAPAGHPAIWTKLLSHFLHAAMEQGIERIYANVTDQPLPVNTFAGVGFQIYGRQTIWRLFTPIVENFSHLLTATIRPLAEGDVWALEQLYSRTVPSRVQQADGWQMGGEPRLPILSGWPAERGQTYVLVDRGEVRGVVVLATGRHGSWLELWTDTLRPDHYYIRQLICFGLTLIRERHWQTPVYMAVADYHGSTASVLAEYGFAPFSDRVRLVKHVLKWMREKVNAPAAVIESGSEIIPTSFVLPETLEKFPVAERDYDRSRASIKMRNSW